MPFVKRGDVVHSEATSGFNNQKKSLLINGLAALGDSHRPLQFCFCVYPPVVKSSVLVHGLWLFEPDNEGTT